MQNIEKEIENRLSTKGFLKQVMGNDLINYKLPAGTFIIETNQSRKLVYKEVYNCCFDTLALVYYDHIKTRFSFIMANIGSSIQWFRLEKC